MRRWIVVTLLLVVWNTLGAARKLTPCVEFLGNSPMFGPVCDGPGVYNDQTANRPGDITKLNLYYDGQCISGIKPQYGFDSRDAKVLGAGKGSGKSLKFPAKDHITGFEYAGNRCLEYLRFITASGQQIFIGRLGAGSPVRQVLGPVPGSYVWAFRGWQGKQANSNLCQFQVIWAVGSCEPVASPGAPLTKQQQEVVPVPVPTPVPVPVPTPVPLPVPTPVPVPVPTPVNVTVQVPTPVPVPTPVNISVKVPVPTPTPVPVLVPIPVPVVAPYSSAVPRPVLNLCPESSIQQTLRSDPETSMCVLAKRSDMNGTLYSNNLIEAGAARKTTISCWMSKCEVFNSASTSYGELPGSQNSGMVTNRQNSNVQMGYSSGGGLDPVLSPGIQNQEMIVRDPESGEKLTVTLYDENSQPAPTIVTPPPGYVPLAEDTAVLSASMGLAGMTASVPTPQPLTGPLSVEDGPPIRATFGANDTQSGMIKYVTPAIGRKLQTLGSRISIPTQGESGLPKLAFAPEGSNLSHRSLVGVETPAASMRVARDIMGISWSLQDAGRSHDRQLKAVGNTDVYAAAAAGAAVAEGRIVYAAKCYQMCVGMGQQTRQTTVTPSVQQG